jgi:outer membrane receptor for ferrienterochelin and colicins
MGREPMLKLGEQTRWAVWAVLVLCQALLTAQNVSLAATPPFTGGVQGDELLLFQEIPSVYSASRFDQKTSEAPASVTIVTSQEIKAFGYRTLADILRSVPGFFVTYDRNYHYIGVRGFGRPGDYNSRVLLLIDGHRVNDQVYDQAPIGTDFPLDIDLIDRVEVVRGPSSSVYGANAFFGVVNVITRRGKDLKGTELSGDAGSYNTYKGRLTYGNRFENGFEGLASGSYMHSAGQSLSFKEFDRPETSNGVARHCDTDEFQSYFSSLSYKDFSLEGVYSTREKGIPTAPIDLLFNDPAARTIDEHGFLDFKFQHAYSNQLGVMARLFYDHYDFSQDSPYNPGLPNQIRNRVLFRDEARGESLGGEVQLTKRLFDSHNLVMGAEYRRNFRQDQFSFDETPFFQYLNNRQDSANWGIYAQDEYEILPNLRLNAGLRFDTYESFGGFLDPRAALIYQPFDKTVLKLLYGRAFRIPNVFELFYQDGGSTQKASTNLQPETIDTYEMVWEQYIGKHLMFSVSGYYYSMDNLITLQVDPQDRLLVFHNVDQVTGKGIELQLGGKWPNGIQGRASYAWQRAEDAFGNWLTNSPEHQAKLNLMFPLIADRLFGGSELLYMSPRKTVHDKKSDDSYVMNLTLSAPNLFKGLDLSASVYNLFNQNYGDPGSDANVQNLIPQDGISFRVKATYAF